MAESTSSSPSEEQPLNNDGHYHLWHSDLHIHWQCQTISIAPLVFLDIVPIVLLKQTWVKLKLLAIRCCQLTQPIRSWKTKHMFAVLWWCWVGLYVPLSILIYRSRLTSSSCQVSKHTLSSQASTQLVGSLLLPISHTTCTYKEQKLEPLVHLCNRLSGRWQVCEITLSLSPEPSLDHCFHPSWRYAFKRRPVPLSVGA